MIPYRIEAVLFMFSWGNGKRGIEFGEDRIED